MMFRQKTIVSFATLLERKEQARSARANGSQPAPAARLSRRLLNKAADFAARLLQ